MSKPQDRRREVGLTVLALFLLLMARACAFGFQYYPQLDDYIQYHNYLQGAGFWQLQQSVGLLASRPLAGVADYFLWGPMFDHMIWGVAVLSLLYAVTAVLLREILSRYFRISPIFLVIMVLLPLGIEGTYWMSASTRIVVGLFFAALTARVFLKWLDDGGFGWLLLYLILQLLPFGFYEQAGIFSITLTVGIAVLEATVRRKRLFRCALSLWGVPAMGLYFLVTRLLSNGGVYSSRAELALPFTRYYWNTFLPDILGQLRDVFVTGNFFILVKGFVRGVRMILSGQLLLWAVAVAALCLLLWFVSHRKDQAEGQKGAFWLALLAGLLLAVGPVSIFLVLGNPWFSMRGAVTSLPGLALMVDTVLLALWDRVPLKRDGPTLLAALMAFVFCVAGASEIGDYRDTYENDQRIAALVLDTLEADGVGWDSGRIGILNLESSYLPNQNYFYHEHIHGCTESSWAFSGLLTCVGGGEAPAITPLPSDPIYRQWNAETNRPAGFDVLYYFDGTQLERAVLRETGEDVLLALNEGGETLGVIWEENGIGYFRTPEQLPSEISLSFS